MTTVEMTFEGGRQVKVRVGYGLIPAASEHIRVTRQNQFKASMELLRTAVDATLAQEEICRTIETYKDSQIPTDDEIKMWLMTPAGFQFALYHGTKKTAAWSLEEAADAMDQVTEGDFQKITDAIRFVAFGREVGERMQKVMEASKVATDMRLDRYIAKIKQDAAGVPENQETATPPVASDSAEPQVEEPLPKAE